MIWLWLGSVGFLFFLIYDFNQIKWNRKIFKPCFFIGCLFIIGASGGIIFNKADVFDVNVILKVIFLIAALIFLSGLIYTLFFAIPFKEAYICGSKQNIYTKGVYALCRHPGVLLLFGFYFFYSAFLGNVLMFKATFLFSFLNFLYALLQDRLFFPKLFNGYDEYKRNVPFLIPNSKSVKNCLRDIKTMGAARGQDR